ncbi:uncharacterized protein LOC127855906 [Dreissena polymorpha]|uniref:B box-type domain-containing protein n=1 Tax=Dreissena polymorpha TaxID=45954 RepID=A0A9D4HIK8_DREPO|nr:uncharacterized protein LOC127855906 [Dreissena polymorpha]KAH3717996.1 hypothetical protein DPMN_060793 [Dreissena polymorpha]
MATYSKSTVASGSDSFRDFCCFPCLENKIDQWADFYCENCQKFYCAKCINRHGQLFGTHVTYGRGDTSKWPVAKEVEDFLQKCDLHEDKHLEMFCEDHSQLCCTNCVDQVFIVQGKSEYNVSIPSDLDKNCYINDICVLSEDQILVADCKNNRVKLLNHQYQVVGHYDFYGYPRDMCKITPSEVAVTVYQGDLLEVQFVSVNGGQLVKGRWMLQFYHECIGIAHDLQDLYLTSGTALYKYSMKGDLLKKLYEDTSDKLTVLKCAVSPSGDKIFITNNTHHKVLTLARDGTVLQTFTDPDLQNPAGIHVTALGQVLVCGTSSSTIIQLDGEGKKKLATLATKRDRLDEPNSVFYNRSTAFIILGQWSSILVLRVK